MGTSPSTTNGAFFEFTIASSCSEFIVLIFQLSAVEGIAIEETISTRATHDVFITANHQIPVVTAEVVINISTVRRDIIFTASRAVISKAAVARRDAISNFRAVIYLSIGTDADTVGPRIIVLRSCLDRFAGFIFVAFTLVNVTDTSITSEFYVANAVFQSAYANAEVVEFVSIFVSEFVDEGALFDRSFVHVSHSFCDHFSSFVTSNVTVALEVLAVNAWMMPASANSTTDL